MTVTRISKRERRERLGITPDMITNSVRAVEVITHDGEQFDVSNVSTIKWSKFDYTKEAGTVWKAVEFIRLYPNTSSFALREVK